MPDKCEWCDGRGLLSCPTSDGSMEDIKCSCYTEDKE